MHNLRYYFIYRGQMITNLLLGVGIGVGIFFIQILVTSPEVRSTLTLLFVIITLFLACAHLCVVVLNYRHVINPIEQMGEILDNWTTHLNQTDPEALSVEKVRETLRSMDKIADEFQSAPAELKAMQATYYETLKTLQAIMEKMSGDMILMGMGRICSQVAHDIRGPVSAISSLATAIPKLATENERNKAAQVIAQSASKLTSMAEELLDYRRASSVNCKPMDLSVLIDSVCQELRFVAQSKKVHLDLELASIQSFSGDSDKLSRVIQNLVSNSIQAVETQGDGYVQVKMANDGNQIVLNITDNGPGFPQEHVEKMFKTGFTTKGKRGNGLGLIYCANVVKAHGGQIRASNLPDGGAEVAILLPYEAAH